MAVFDTQHPWALAFGLIGNIISLMVFLAPAPTFYRICKKKSTEGFQSLPYLVALFSSMLWLYYGMIKGDMVLLMTINAFGCVAETIYIALYIAYATKDARKLTIKLFLAMNAALFLMIVLFAHFALKGPIRVEVVGWINVAFAVGVFAAPLSIIAQVAKTKSVEFMPFKLSFFLTINAITWFGYGMLKHDKCVAIPNILGFLLSLFQMVLYAIYRNSSKKIVEEKKPQEETKECVVLGTIRDGDQVHPDDVVPHDIIINVHEEPKDAKQEDKKEKNEDGHEESMRALHSPNANGEAV